MPGTHLLPPNLLKLFAPRPPLPYSRPLDRDIDRVRPKNVGGVASLLSRLTEEKDNMIAQGGPQADAVAAEGMEEGEEPTFTLAEEVKREMRREERKKLKADKFKQQKESYKPGDDAEAVGDPYKTLFIARLQKSVTEKDLRREYEVFGSIERVRIVRDKQGRSRGYAFIVFEREREMKNAYKDGDGLVIMGKRVMVDVERGRTVRGWKPRRLGGGLGGRPKKEEPPAVGGGLRGGRGGGFGGRGGGGGGFRGGGGRGGGFGDRGGFRGGRGGGFSDRGGFGGGGPDRGYGDRGPPGGGFRGRDDFGPPGGGRGGFGGGDRGGGFGGGRGGGIGYQGGGFGDRQPPNNFGGGGPPMDYGPPPNGGGFGGPPGPGGPPGGGFGGPPGDGYGPPGGFKRQGPGGFDDRDSKRPRY